MMVFVFGNHFCWLHSPSQAGQPPDWFNPNKRNTPIRIGPKYRVHVEGQGCTCTIR